mgnify:CR=1 FL=1
MVHLDGIWNDDLRVWNSWGFFEIKDPKLAVPSDVIWNDDLRVCNCWESFESQDAKWCIPTLFETLFGAAEIKKNNCISHVNTQKSENKNNKWYILTLLQTIYYEPI